MKKALILFIICMVCIIVYTCRPGYVVCLGCAYYNQISEGVGFKRVYMNADVKSFKVNEKHQAYAVDSHKAYYFGKPIFGSDGTTFMVLQGSYQKDKYHVYYQNHIIPTADPATFKVSPMDASGHEPLRFAEDKNEYYYCGKAIGVYDKESFKQWYVKGHLWGLDSKYCYCAGNKCEITDYDSFKILSSGLYAKDRKQVYYLGEIVKDADSKTFVETNIFCGEDKNRLFDMGVLIKYK